MGLFIEQMELKPSDAALKKTAIIGAIISALSYAIMAYLMYLSGTDVTKTITSQLSFSGPFLRELYFETLYINYYRIAQILDYVFMVGYGSLLFSLSVTVARNSTGNPKIRNLGFIAADLAIIAALCDAFENMFILITLMNPLGFPAWQAVLHSVFAVIKWGLLLFVIGYNIGARIQRR